MADEPDTTPIQSRYAEQFAADLKDNREEQEAVSARIAGLEARLTQLKADETWLTGQLASADTQQAPHAGEEVHETAPSTGLTSEDAAKPGSLPTQRQGTTSSKDDAGAAGRSRKRPAAKKATAKRATAEKSTRPLLQDVVLSLLRAHPGEPRTAREIHTAVEGTGRASSHQTTRNTLERLVAKGLVERQRRQGSVMYTALTPVDEVTPPADIAAAPRGADVSESVAAEV
ncbi:BlaI/MecI/CopY family transcriptional regulator [Streptomyces sp. NPDC127098]|uniref:BlaI/MecI/CopY family transcriptional regulator n=1 Tax=Streptomyces sp. NPDC127098 TaxID=3347137 RepID=UPI00365FBE10